MRTTQVLIDQEVAKRCAQIDRDAAYNAEKLDEKMKALQEKEAELCAREKALEKEKAEMSEGTQMKDVFQLNVGGMRTCAVTRKTLCSVPDSMLASMFSGRWDEQLSRDNDGHVFVDFSPDIFMPLLDWLRGKSIEDSSDPTPGLTIPCDKRDSFLQMCKYFGISAPFRVLYKSIKRTSLTETQWTIP